MAAKKIALISGANKGIGFEVSKQLAQAGYMVLLGARNPANGQQAAAKLTALGFDVRPITLDLLDPGTLTAAADLIGKDFGHLDVLVNNAGIAQQGDGPPGTADLAKVRTIFDTNFFGTLAVTQAMLPLLRAATSARIVNVSSGLGSLTLHSDPAWPYASVKAIGYCASKSALNMLTVQLAWELRDTKIKVNSADPGYTATDLNGNSGHQTIEEGSEETVRLALLPEDGPTGTYSDRAGLVPW